MGYLNRSEPSRIEQTSRFFARLARVMAWTGVKDTDKKADNFDPDFREVGESDGVVVPIVYGAQRVFVDRRLSHEIWFGETRRIVNIAAERTK